MIDLSYETVLKAGDAQAFYANFDTPITDSTFSDWYISIVHADSFIIVYDNFATLTQDTVTGGYRFYCEFTVPVGIPEGCYRFMIYHPYATGGSDTVKYMSNEIKVISNSSTDTMMIKYRNAVDMQNFGYAANTSFYNIARLPMEKENPQRQKINKGYPEIDGDYKRVRTITRKAYNFITGRLDEEAHDAFDIATIHSDFQISEYDGATYTQYERPEDADYEADTTQDFPLSQGNIQLRLTSYNSSNRGI